MQQIENKRFSQEEQIYPENKKESFFSGLKGRLMSLALAGFIVFGPGSLKETYADQLKFSKQGKAKAEFVLEPGITKDKLELFKQKLALEEPKFMAWAERYKQEVSASIDKITDQILNFDKAKDEEEEKLLRNFVDLLNSVSPDGHILFSANVIAQNDHKTLDLVRQNKDSLKEVISFIKDNLDDIIFGLVLMDDSRATREVLRKSTSPNIDFHYHNFYFYIDGILNPAGITVVPSSLSDKSPGRGISGPSRPFIKFNPSVFGHKKEGIKPDQFISFFIHELVHALRFGSLGYSAMTATELGSVMRRQLLEGIAQNVTYELVQHLSSKKIGLSPNVGETDYDQRVVLVGLIQAILKAGGRDDALAKWDSFLIKDVELLKELERALISLGLDTKIAGEVERLKLSAGVSFPARETIIGILARLKIEGVEISPKLVKDTIIYGRELPNWKIIDVDNIIINKDLPRDMSRKEQQIRSQSRP